MILGDRFGGTAFLTTVAMIAFAANSLLCRMALGAGAIDAASFATIRVASGTMILTLMALPGWRTRGHDATDFIAVAVLFLYMAFFSFAYLSLAAGTGALILFGTVQLTMFAAAIVGGERFNGLSWLGLAFALAGLIYLVSPGLSAPDPLGAILMTVAGIAWGFYSLRGRHAVSALGTTANCFIYSLPLVVIVSVIFLEDMHTTPQGIALAIASGTIASGLGYVIWFAALRGLTAGRAATVQLSVPVIAALGGVLLLSEVFTSRLLIASVATLGGIWLVLAQRVRSVTAE
ncbi:MAG: DMT family transporter [Gammaproteobacteria bacterium]